MRRWDDLFGGPGLLQGRAGDGDRPSMCSTRRISIDRPGGPYLGRRRPDWDDNESLRRPVAAPRRIIAADGAAGWRPTLHRMTGRPGWRRPI
jgi:hypothetical protein